MQDSNIRQNFLNSMRGITSTVNVISADAKGQRHAMTATSVTSLSLDPPSMLVCINKEASLHKILLDNSNFCINVLSSLQKELAEVCSNSEEGESRFVSESWKNLGPYIYNEESLSNMYCTKTDQDNQTSLIKYISAVKMLVNSPGV